MLIEETKESSSPREQEGGISNLQQQACGTKVRWFPVWEVKNIFWKSTQSISRLQIQISLS